MVFAPAQNPADLELLRQYMQGDPAQQQILLADAGSGSGPTSPWVGPQNKITPAKIDPAWNKTLTPKQAQGMAWMRGSFAPDAQPTLPVEAPHPAATKKPVVQHKKIQAAPTEVAPKVEEPAAPAAPADPNADALGAMALNSPDMESLHDQEAGIADLAARYQNLRGQDPKLDLSPLLAYSDSLRGTQLGKSYKAPMNQDELNAQADALQGQLQKEKQGLSQDQIELLKSALSAEGNRMGIGVNSGERLAAALLNTQMKEKTTGMQTGSAEKVGAGHDAATIGKAVIGAQAKGAGNGGKLMGDYQKRFDAAIKDTTKGMEKIDSAEQNLELAHSAAGNPTAFSALRLELAGAIANRLNRQEIEAMGSTDNNALANKVEQIYESAVNSRITDTNYAFLKKYIQVAKQAKERHAQNALTNTATQYLERPENKGKTLQQAKKELGGSFYHEEAEQGAGEGAASGGGSKALFDAEDARRAALKAGK